jgi:outer membrane protein assembly factor BamA
MNESNSDSYYRADETVQESDSLIETNLRVAIQAQNLVQNSHGVKSGGFFAISYQAAPDQINAISSYQSLSTRIQTFIPIIDIQRENTVNNLFSAYLAIQATGNYHFGEYTPTHLYRGGSISVRGLEQGRFPDPLNATANMELRVNLPAIIFHDILPGFMFFVDSGITGQTAQSLRPIFSTGGAAFISVAESLQIGVRFAYLTNETTMQRRNFASPVLMLQFEF